MFFTYDSIPDSTSDSVLDIALDILPDISSDSIRGSSPEQNFVGRLDFYCVHVAKFWLQKVSVLPEFVRVETPFDNNSLCDHR